MGFLFGKKDNDAISQSEPRINAITYEQSTFGAVKNVVYGTNRVCGNIIDSVDFTVIGHTTETSSGKGGGRTSSSTSYTYKARVAIGLCYGPIQGIKKILVSDSTYSLSDLNLNLFKGSNSQDAWGEMKTFRPERALKYRNLAYVAGYIDLTSSASVPQYNFETNGLFTANTDDISPIITEGFNYSTEVGTLVNVTGTLEYSSYYTSDNNIEIIYYDSDGIEHTIEDYKNYSRSGATYTFNLSSLGAVSAHVYVTYNSTVRLDANPKDIISDILTNEIYGAGFPSENIGDLSDYSKFCIASNVFLSPVYDSQEEAQRSLTDLANITNASFIWTQGLLKLAPLGDEEITGNGVTWTPDLTPVYDLMIDDFQSDDEPIICTRSQQTDVYNSVKIEFLNRANNYNVEVVEAQDLANIELYGPRPADTTTAHQICTAEVAKKTAQLALDRAIAVRNKYSFKLSLKYILLDSMDIVTLTYDKLGLDREPVRILEIKENDGLLEIEAEELVIGTATPAKIQHQRATRETINYNQSVGNVNPAVIFEPPFELTQDTLEVWVGVSVNNNLFGGAEIWVSDDGTTYKNKGEIKIPCRQGVLSAVLPTSSTEIDTANTLKIDMTISKAELLSGTQQDAQNLNTLCYVDGELMAYQNATLTDTDKYNLTFLKRGAYDTTIKAHSSNTQFARIDESAFLPIPFKKEDIGKQIHVKICSFNVFGSGYQSLADVDAQSYTITGEGIPTPKSLSNITTNEVGWLNKDGIHLSNIDVSWDISEENQNYVIQYSNDNGANWVNCGNSSVNSMRIEGVKTGDTIVIGISAVNIYGVSSEKIVSAPITIIGKDAAPPDVEGFACSFDPSDTTKVKIRWSKVDIVDLRGYEIREGVSFESGTPISSLLYNTEEYIYTLTENRTYYFWIKAVDNSYNYSTNAVSVTLQGKINPDQVINFFGVQNGEYINLNWSTNADTDITGYEIREGTSWDIGSLVATGITNNSYQIPVSSEKTYYYTIRAKNRAGNYSNTSAFTSIIVSNLPPKNVLSTYDEIVLKTGAPSQTAFGPSSITWNTVTGTWDDYPATSWDALGSNSVLRLFDTVHDNPSKNLLMDFSESLTYDYYGNTITTIGNPTLSGGKYVGDGTGDGLKCSTINSLGSGAWTLEGTFKFAAPAKDYDVLFRLNYYGICLVRELPNKLSLYLSSNGTSYNIASNIQGAKSDWNTTTEYTIRFKFTGTQYIVEWSIDGGVTYTTDISLSSTAICYSNSSSKLYFGINTDEATMSLNGTMDNLRVTVGKARGNNEPFVPEYNYSTSGTYTTTEKDMGQNITVNINVDFQNNASIDNHIFGVQLQFRLKPDGGSYGEWQNFIPSKQTFRYIQFRVNLSTTDITKTPELTIFTINIDVPDTNKRGSSVIAVGGTTINYGYTYKTAYYPIASAVGAGLRAEIQSQTASSFTVKVLNASNTDVGGTINWQVTGY